MGTNGTNGIGCTEWERDFDPVTEQPKGKVTMDERHKSKDSVTIQPRLQRMYRLAELPQFVGLRRTMINEMMEAGKFPRPISLSENGRAIAWLEDELIAWQNKRIAMRDVEK